MIPEFCVLRIRKKAQYIERDSNGISTKLTDYMREKVYSIPRMYELEERRKLTLAEQKELKDIKSKLRTFGTLKNIKKEILNDIIFPAMADLTFFFECLSQSTELESIFGNDVRELLGVIRRDPKPWDYGFMFKRLVTAMIFGDRYSLIPRDDDDRYYRSVDFTIKLTHILQEIILQKVGLTPKFKMEKASLRIIHDINQGLAWTELLASRVNDPKEFKEPTRTFDFDTIKLLKLKVGK